MPGLSCRWQQSLGFAGAKVYSDAIGDASAAKMCRQRHHQGDGRRSPVASHGRRHGVEDAVLASLQDLFPVGDWRANSRVT